MEISVLQSLIDRTSNDIAMYEYAINIAYPDDGVIKDYKIRIAKLVKIQKALKKEIACEIERKRFIMLLEIKEGM
jgi:hypothetical protein